MGLGARMDDTKLKGKERAGDRIIDVMIILRAHSRCFVGGGDDALPCCVRHRSDERAACSSSSCSSCSTCSSSSSFATVMPKEYAAFEEARLVAFFLLVR